MTSPKPPACRYANQTLFPLAAAVHLGGRESKYTMSVAVKASFLLIPGKDLEPLGKQEDFRGDEFANPADLASELVHGCDLAMWKPGADLLLRGTCHAPGTEPVTVCDVGWRVGEWSKILRLSGDRVWRPGLFLSSIGEAAPFRSMPLSWSRAFGGLGIPTNPVGRGARGDLLPNLEYPDRMLQRRNQKVEPAGFAPINRMWAPRSGKMGTYDKKHFERVHPRFPTDFDWSYFCEAPADQQLGHYLRGDESIAFRHLFPGVAEWQTQLPGKRIRVFVTDTDEQGVARIREVIMLLDTLAVDTDAGVLALVWRGLLPVRSEDRGEVSQFYVVEEPLAEAERPAAEHIARMPTAPDLFQTKWDEGMAQVEASKAATQAMLDRYGLHGEVEKALADPGLTPERLACFPFTPNGPLPPEVDGEARAALAKAQEQFVRAMAEATKMAAEHGVDINARAKSSAGPMAQLAETVAKSEEYLKSAGQEVPPALKDLIAKIKANPKDPFGMGARLAEVRGQGLDLSKMPGANAIADGAGLDAAMVEMGGGGAAAPSSEPVPSAPPASSPAPPAAPGSLWEALGPEISAAAGIGSGVISREVLLGIKHSGQSFAGGNWAGGDFSGMDLAGTDFTGAILTRANFVGAHLEGALFVGTTAQDADFTDAYAAKARFEDADFTRASFVRADLSGAIFTSLSLAQASFLEARMVGCQLSFASMEGVDLRRADCSESTMDSLAFTGSPMEGVIAIGAHWSMVLCNECCLEDAVFDRAVLDSVVLSACRARRIHLIAANLKTLRVINGCDLSEAVAVGAQADGSTWMHTILVQAVFDDASLRGVCMMDSWCEGARFQRADLSFAMLRRSCCARADFQAANLFQAGFGLADLQGASLMGANCYEADFTDARTTDADLRLARLTRTSLSARK